MLDRLAHDQGDSRKVEWRHAGAQSLGLRRHQRVAPAHPAPGPASAGSSSSCAADRSWIGLISPASGCPVTERTQLEGDTERSEREVRSARKRHCGAVTRERDSRNFRSVTNAVVSRVAQGRRRGASAGFSAGGFLAAQGKPSGSKGRHRASGLPNGRPPPGGYASPGARPSSHSLATVSSASGNSSASIRSFATTLQAGRVARVSVAWQSGRLAQAMPEDYREIVRCGSEVQVGSRSRNARPSSGRAFEGARGRPAGAVGLERP